MPDCAWKTPFWNKSQSGLTPKILFLGPTNPAHGISRASKTEVALRLSQANTSQLFTLSSAQHIIHCTTLFVSLEGNQGCHFALYHTLLHCSLDYVKLHCP